MEYTVTAFTDTYLPTVNGVTYTLKTWRDCWNANGGRMDVVYPQSDEYTPDAGEHPVGSLPFPFYEGFRLGAPSIPDEANGADLIHAHSPFSVGLAGLRLARRLEAPFVTSYHTPAGEYAGYVGPTPWIEDKIRGTAETYERWFFDRAAVVLVPSEWTLRHVRSQVGVRSRVEVVGNGVDTDRFRPVDATDFLERHGLADAERLVGYTGRHGYEKNLDEVVELAEGLDATVVLAGDGPAREFLEDRAAEVDGDVRFLGFLDREDLSAFYSSLDVFAFPSPVETQGLVALEANACGTPVVAVDSGALSDTIDDGDNGFHYESRDVDQFRDRVRAALSDNERLVENCLARREPTSVDRSIARLGEIYRDVL